MKKTVYQVQVKVYLEELQKFYADNPAYGSIDKPYPANSFFEVKCPGAKFWGPLKNILILESDSSYQWTITSKDDVTLKFSTGDDSFLEFEMLSQDPTPQKWNKIFDDPTIEGDKVKVKPAKKDEDVFEVATVTEVEPSVRFKYSFLFEFIGSDNSIKYGSIDPDGVTIPPPR